MARARVARRPTSLTLKNAFFAGGGSIFLLRPSDATESHHEHVKSRPARPGQQSKPRRGVSVIHPRVTASRFAESSNRSAMASSPGDDTRLRCAVLVGAVGAGKSSIGNALCQKPSEPPPFRSRRSASGVTTACACAPCLAPGLGGAVVSSASERWWVVDTPGLRDGDDARAPEHLLRAIEACASPAGDINPTGGVDVFLLVFNATGRVSSGDLEAIETLKRRFGAARFLERAVAVFTHADVLIADGDANDENDENEIAASYLRDAPPALASLLRAAGGGEPVFADVRARGIADTTLGTEKRATEASGRRFPEALAEAVRRVDRVAARSPLRSASGDPRETRVVAADVAAAAEARLPRLGMKAARRRRQEVRKQEDGLGLKKTPVDWVGDAFAWFSSVVAPPPSKPEPATDRTVLFTGDDASSAENHGGLA